MRFLFRLLRFLFLAVFILALLGGAAAGGLLYYLVVVRPGPEMNESHIASVLGRESPVYYRNGQDKIGVLFQDAHRQYLPYEQIPQSFIKAIVAAEDDRFFHHYGVDPAGIARAMLANYRAGRIVQGGSTITQQTAKNLFKRESRSYQAKLKELLFALRLEYHFSKEKILEFYSNQFFVSGNGHGLGIAARYYFDKAPDELTLLESAFIAGSVKRPSAYNPFSKKDQEGAEKAKKRASDRATYVLGQMYGHGMISQQEYTRALVEGLNFNQGKMSFDLNIIMDLVKEGLSTSAMKSLLEDHGISNVATSGVRIITTVDRDLQQAVLGALRSELSRLDIRLRGYQRGEVQKEYAAIRFNGDQEIIPAGFFFGTITAIEGGGSKNPVLRVSLEEDRAQGIIDRQGLEETLTALVRYRRQSWDKATDKDLHLLLQELQVGDRVFVAVREIRDEGVLLDLHRFPELQGAAMVQQLGAIRAMAGGADNKFYNRAIQARRLMGSTFKPFLFSAALQLGWSTTDLLDNRRNVFVFSGRPYYPKPDHHSPFAQVSMSWAGIKSENLAAVWLLYHLTDRLTPPELRDLATRMGMTPGSTDGQEESYQRFTARMQSRYGILINRGQIEQAAYEEAVRGMETDLLFEGREGEYLALHRLPFGTGFSRFRQDLLDQLGAGGLSQEERQELHQHLSTLNASYQGYQASANALAAKRRTLSRWQTDASWTSSPSGEAGTQGAPAGSFLTLADGRTGFTIGNRAPAGSWVIPDHELAARTDQMMPQEQEVFWNNILIEGTFSASTLAEVSRRAEAEKLRLSALKPYSLDVLLSVRDYRVMLGLQYLLHLGREVGINSPLEPVLSFPLGSNVITLSEAVSMYETLVTGSRHLPDGGLQFNTTEDDEGDNDYTGLAVIERIETDEGKILYQRRTESRPVYGLKTSAAIAQVLQNTVQYGTGNQAFKEVRLHSKDPRREEELQSYDLPVPLLGKTGTANGYRNSAFFGYVPTLDGERRDAMVLDNGYTVGVYVGFDNNQPMTRRSTRISGAAGSLGTWSMIADTLLRHEQTGELIDTVDLTFNGLGLRYPPAGEVFIAADPERGGIITRNSAIVDSAIAPSSSLHILSYGENGADDRYQPARSFLPFWKTSGRENLPVR